MKIKLLILSILVIPILFIISNQAIAPIYAQNSLKYSTFIPSINPSYAPLPNRTNVLCTNAWAEYNINKWSPQALAHWEKVWYSLAACDVYRYMKGCTNQNDESCTKPCSYIINGPSAEQIQNYPGVKDNLAEFLDMSDSLFRKFWIYAKAITRFDLRNGFGLNEEGKQDMFQTLSSMTCAERSEEIGHHIGTPLYFYPERTMQLKVILPNGATANIKAFPDGTFSTDGKRYSSLSYEINTRNFNRPARGSVIDGKNLKRELERVVYKLKFTPKEKVDFISYWLEKLPKSNYYFVSLFDHQQAYQLTNWQVSPAPDTEIRYIFYFKPMVEKPHDIDTSYSFLPEPRIGFTVLDWGGVIEW